MQESGPRREGISLESFATVWRPAKGAKIGQQREGARNFSYASPVQTVVAVNRKWAPSRQSKQAPEEEYREVWDTLNRYIGACLDAKKGLNVTNFCKIGYQLENRNSVSKTKLKPHFQLAESLAKAYNVDKKSGTPLSEKDLVPCEEFNFSKAAIKYSNVLTKDTVFCGLKYMVQQVGETIAKGGKLNLAFEHGKLLADERKVRFVFRADLYAKFGSGAWVLQLTTGWYLPRLPRSGPAAR